MTDLDAFARDWERREEALALEHYNQYAGLAASTERMTALASEIEARCRDGLARWRRGDVPDLLWLAMLGNAEAREQTRLQNEIYRRRNEAVVVDVAGEKIHLNNVRLFNHRHARDAKLRKRVFDALMEKAKALTPLVEERFRLSERTYGAHGLTPLDAYLVEERLDVHALERLVDDAARRAKPHFERLAREITPDVLGKQRMEYYDDMYVYRHVVYEPVDQAFQHVDYAAALRRTATQLGLPVHDVAIDGEAREGKYASPVCFGIRIPGDVRVLYQRTSPFGDYESFYHEMGHGLHFASVDATRPFWERRLIPSGVAEIFSTLVEDLAVNPHYLREDVGLDDAAIREVARRRRFMDLWFLTFYGANSMHKIRFWSEGLARDLAKADEVYEDLTERYMGVRVPGRYWQTHHILSMSDVYAPSYLLAHVRKSELVAALETRFGARWWRSAEAGRFLREEAMGPGGGIRLDAFSRLDPTAYLAQVLPPA